MFPWTNALFISFGVHHSTSASTNTSLTFVRARDPTLGYPMHVHPSQTAQASCPVKAPNLWEWCPHIAQAALLCGIPFHLLGLKHPICSVCICRHLAHSSLLVSMSNYPTMCSLTCMTLTSQTRPPFMGKTSFYGLDILHWATPCGDALLNQLRFWNVL